VDNIHAAAIGTRKHAVAAELIDLRLKQPNTTQTFNMYVNDAIGYRMRPEQVLYHSPWAFGTADAIGFGKNPDPDGKPKILRIFDLKTGTSKASGVQLALYAAFFCLEYRIKPYDIEFDLRIYQNDEIYYIEVEVDEILHMMSRATELSILLAAKQEEEV